ncbi:MULTISPECIES: DoxX family protein [unclassified Rhizobium]|uniref:DoxX family protein n=1 Tax=unclassified Rhizobium TaxID=2613769 RepID=UPI001FE1D787|nr:MULTISPECIES: DoxX family protein [unclassified Rhizobium]
MLEQVYGQGDFCMLGEATAENVNVRRISWAGWTISSIVILVLAADAAVNLFSPAMVGAQMQETGFPTSLAFPLGLIILLCAILYAIPRTAMLGAILITGFLGGAICTHFRLGEIGSPPQLISLLLGVMAWGGLYFRDKRLRNLLPVRSAIG